MRGCITGRFINNLFGADQRYFDALEFGCEFVVEGEAIVLRDAL